LLAARPRQPENRETNIMTIERPMFPPVDQARRHLLTIAAGGAVAAAIPTAALTAAPEIDPIFEVIARHRAACKAHTEAVRIEFAFEDGFTLDERRGLGGGKKLRQFTILQEQTADAYDRLDTAGTDLVNTPPTTLAGIAALCRYIEPLLSDPDTTDLPETVPWDDDSESTAAGALANSIAVAIREISKGGAA
jgi:hypothetical protein